MHETETKQRGADAPAAGPAHEVKAAMAGFLSDFIDFRNDIKTQLKEQEHRLTMLDRKTIAAERPALSASADLDAPHKKAFAAYLRSGEWKGKAGGYAIQGLAAALIPEINGSYTNVVGLPLTETMNMLTGAGYPVPLESPAP